MTLLTSGRKSRLAPDSGSGRTGSGLIGRLGRMGRGTALACLPLLVAACGQDRDPQSDVAELRLTRDAEWNSNPFFSPDGSRIGFSRREDNERYVLCTVPAAGGEPRQITSDTTSFVGLRWTPGGDIFAIDYRSERIVRLDEKGSVVEELPDTPLAWPFDVSADGTRYLFGKFNGDNYDPALFDPAAGKLEFIAETKASEVNGSFGPGAGEATLVVAEGLAAETTTLQIMDLDTGVFEPLPLPEARLDGPSWSPDGRYLLFTCNQAKSQDIWVYDRETKEAAPLTSGPEEDVAPSWSPDGARITFARRTSQENVFVVDPATSEVRQLTSGTSRDTSPLIAPDGSAAAYVHVPSTSDQQQGMVSDIHVISSDGGEPRALGLRGLKSKSERSFCWSPDGKELALALDDGSGDTEIFRVPIQGGEPVPVTLGSGVEHFPAWSPDGKWIAYTSFQAGETQVWAIPATGGLPVQVSRHSGVNRLPVWSWDSRSIAYHTIEEQGGSAVWIASFEDPGAERIVHRGADWTVPFAWTRSGDELLVFRVKEGEWAVRTLPLDGSEGIVVGTPNEAEGPLQYVLSFTEAGERYRDDVYPEGLVACSDGERISEIYVLRVTELLSGPLTANRR